MKHNAYQLISELLLKGPHPNVDMLVIKPTLFIYVSNDRLQDAIKNGIRTDPSSGVRAYFSRVPETIDKYKTFLSNNSPIRIMISKLKRVKDQQIRIQPINLDGYQNSLTEDDIKKISQNNRFFTSYFEKQEDLDKMPHTMIWSQRGIIPAFCLKILSPEKRLIA